MADEQKLFEELMKEMDRAQNEYSPRQIDSAATRIEIKVYGGTSIHGNSLCNTCRNAHRVRGLAESQEMVFCSANSSHEKRVPFPISKCSMYDDERLPSLYEMKEIAWQIVTKPNRQIGFVSAKEFKRLRNKEMIEDDEHS